MEGNSVIEWIKQKKLETVLLLVGVILVGAGVFSFKSGITEPQVKILGSEEAKEDNRQRLVVDVGGAVAAPGVYELWEGARVEEAIASAGGWSGDVDTDWVDRYLNRSRKLMDGEKIYIPRITSTQIPNPNSQANSNIQIQNSKININTAGTGELDTLPGIGPVTAGKIIAGRPYSTTEELVTKKVVTNKVWEQIKDLVSVW